MMFDDINFLVQETLRDAQDKSQLSFFNNLFSKNSNIKKNTAGVLYRVQKNHSTFVIRTHPSNELEADIKNLVKHRDMYPSLRFSEDDNLDEELRYFVCSDIKSAKLIQRRFGNKRFPIQEEFVLNVSDPSDCWWFKAEDNKFSIHFKLTNTNRMDELIKLGPLGDPDDFIEKLSQMAGYFQMLFPVSDFSSHFGEFSIATSEHDSRFNQLMELFVSGNTNQDFWDYLSLLEQNNREKDYIESLKTANSLMKELSELRSFWCEIELRLKNKS